MTIEIYTDGGVCLRNPSPHGGAWGFRAVDAETGDTLRETVCTLTPSETGGKPISNINVEVMALAKAVAWAFDDAATDVPRTYRFCSDCKFAVTVFEDGADVAKSQPPVVVHAVNTARRYLAILSREGRHTVEWELLAGHPTRRQLAEGVRRKDSGRVYRVSPHNVDVDRACTRACRELARENEAAGDGPAGGEG